MSFCPLTFSSLKAFTKIKLWKLVRRSLKLTGLSSPSSAAASVLSLVAVVRPSSELLSESNAGLGQA